MKLLLPSLALLLFAEFVHAQNIEKQDAEKIIKTYFSGYMNKDWNITASQLADGFTFSSPAGDDHITLATIKSVVFRTVSFFKK